MSNKLEMEEALWAQGHDFIACTDEVGRGCFAGPVVAAAVIMPKGVLIEGLTDSKAVSKKKHAALAEKVKETALAWAVGVIDVETIDRVNIKQATRLAMKAAIENLEIAPTYILVDGKEVVDLPISQNWVIKGDFHCHGISAASIIAKHYRDELMGMLDEALGNKYGWAKNAGYETKDHMEAARLHGITEHHRKSWATMEKLK